MAISRHIKYLSLYLLTILSACGGGGGGGSGSGTGTTPVQSTAPTLTIGPGNWSALPRQILSSSDTVLATGQFAVELAQRFQARGTALSQTITCNSNGKLMVTLVDADGDGMASAGDRLSVEADHCNPGPFNDIVSGKLDIQLQSATRLAEDRLSGLVQIQPGFTVSRESMTMEGAFVIDWARTPFKQSWSVSASGSNDPKFVQGTNMPASFSLRAPAITKTLDYTTARGQVTLAMRYETAEGSATVSTTTPLSSYLNRVPDQGPFEITGGRGKVRVTASGGSARASADIALLGIAGTPTDTIQYPWSTISSGFLWWDGQTRAGRTLLPVFETYDYLDYYFMQSLVAPAAERMTLPDAVFRAQFSRPPSSIPQLFYRFHDSTSWGGAPAVPDIAANVEVHGALLLVRPAQSLNHGRQYTIQISRDGVNWISGFPGSSMLTLADSDGHEMQLSSLGGFETPGTLLASIAHDYLRQLARPTDVVTLSSTATAANGRSIVGYRWTQVSGTPLAFGSPEAPTTTVRWGTTKPVGVESAVIQLQVRDSTGDTDVTRVTVTSADAAALPLFLFLKREGGVSLTLPASLYFDSPPELATSPTIYEPGRYTLRTTAMGGMVGAYLVLTTLDRSPLAAGHYEHIGAIELYNIYSMPCAVHAGHYDVRDVAFAPDGTFTRLAVDFKHICDGGVPIYGSYRLNSAIPVPD